MDCLFHIKGQYDTINKLQTVEVSINIHGQKHWPICLPKNNKDYILTIISKIVQNVWAFRKLPTDFFRLWVIRSIGVSYKI